MAKFKWIGGNGFKDLDLVIYKILKPTDVLNKGTIVEIPDTQTELITRIKLNGNYEEYVEPVRKYKPRKQKQKEEEEEKEE